MEWLNEPPAWNRNNDELTVTSGPHTDFWRKTHNGAIAHNGHFAFEEVTGDFVAHLSVSGTYTDLYDQAGLMLRIDEEHWLKCGIEFVDSRQYISAVVTRDTSDWSVVPAAVPPVSLALRLVRYGTTVEVYYSLPGQSEQMLRQTSLPATPRVQVGPMCASPTGNGFVARFSGFRIQQT